MTIASSDLLLLNFLVEDKKPGAVPLEALLGRALRALRTYLSVDIAFISEITGAGRVIRHIDTAIDNPRLRVGAVDPFDHSACSDAESGAHICVPVELEGGKLYGMLTCAAPRIGGALNPRDLSIIRVFGELAAEHI